MLRVQPPGTYDIPDVIPLTPDQLKSKSLQELYADLCTKHFGIKKPNAAVLNVLPNSVGSHVHVSEITLTSAYIGKRGLLALLPVLQACVRLEHLDLTGTGLVTSIADALLNVLTSFPRLRSLRLSNNDLGTEIGERILLLVRSNPTLRVVEVDHCLIIPPIKRKIEAAATANQSRPRGSTPPLVLPNQQGEDEGIRASTTTTSVVCPSEDAASGNTNESPRDPAWMVIAIDELRDFFSRHQRHMRDVYHLFFEVESGKGGLVPLTEFVKILRVFGIVSLTEKAPPEQRRVVVLATKLHVYDAAKESIRYLDFINQLRTHASVAADVTNKRDVLSSCARIGDMKDILLGAFQMMDTDNVGVASMAEIKAGVKSLRQLYGVRVVDVEEVVEILFANQQNSVNCSYDPDDEVKVNYVEGLQRVEFSMM
eukprot:PhF_6_TR37123/c0_g1_i5/m.54573